MNEKEALVIAKEAIEIVQSEYCEDDDEKFLNDLKIATEILSKMILNKP